MPILHSIEDQVRDSGVLANAPALAGLPRFAEKLLPLEQAHQLYARVRKSAAGFVLENLLREMKVDLWLDGADLDRIPKKGPVVVVANHPYGMLDGAVLAVLLSRVRHDVKVMTNFLLEGVPELEQHCIFVDPLDPIGSADRNRRALKQAVEWLRQGGMLAMFPAGEVSHWQMPQGAVVDPQWNCTATRLIRLAGAAALPVYFCGRNSLGFQVVGMIHPRVRMAFLLQEFLQQSGKSVALRVGSAIPADSIASIASDREATEYLRWRTYLLAQRGKKQIQLPAALRSVFPQAGAEPITAGLPRELLLCDIDALPRRRCLVENAEFAVYAARAPEIPHLLEEIGRLRELTFRTAGEGTGKRWDLDRFDRYYWHLLLWSKTKSELVGGYRAGNTAEIIAEHGVNGLYTNTLFRFDERLFKKMGTALELGRSFVRPEYQREYAPLLLLWKAIGRFVTLRPETAVLFGAVSISNSYNRASRELIYSFFEARKQGDDLAGLVTPRRPFRPGRIGRWDCHAVAHVLRDLDELSEPIADVETDGKGLPILLKQYAKVGGKLLGFNVDRKFSDVLDGLVVVDLRHTQSALLERYMGREGVAGFRRCHGLA
ncbi:MAG TPA: GNAT family N-acyltransferase [Terriglobales bacterium]|nr:GNAT family N-acyltransferase [Terriglobales bacterium]